MTQVTTAQEKTSHFESTYGDTGKYNYPKLCNLSIRTAINTLLKMLLPPLQITNSQYLTYIGQKSTQNTFTLVL